MDLPLAQTLFIACLMLCLLCSFLVWHNVVLTHRNEERWERIKELHHDLNEARDAYKRVLDRVNGALKGKDNQPTQQKEPAWDTMAR